ncbi:MAG: UDP-2,3-diacylglucosamine diphosphatase [Gammaproteobacteria bacterium]|nr:UDP-2,3-diacylglucosamine diphosphatase [Gammaproteobacteria bacterium]
MTLIFVSDLHLDDVDESRFRCFSELLDVEARSATAIYLLGDLTEIWVGDDDDGPLAIALYEVLGRAVQRCPVYVMHGNRDFLIGKRFADQTGVELIDDPYLLDADTLLSHGDAFCVDDTDYQVMRRLLRSPEWQADILAKSLEERRSFARGLRQQSRLANANKAENIMDVSSTEVSSVVSSHQVSRLVHGHTHRPGQHLSSWGMRYVLGAWEHCGWLLRWTPPSLPRLECFPLTDRYGTGS